MEISFDKEADAVYIEFRKGEFAKNKKIDDFTIIDLDSKGNILGIELLDVSKRIPIESLSNINVKNLLATAKWENSEFITTTKFDENVKVAGDNIKELCNNIGESTAPATGYEAAGEGVSSQEQANQETDF